MGHDQRLQAQRFELKYIISESQAVQIRQYVTSFLELDEHGVGQPDLSYPVHSLYLDSADLQTYWATINGNLHRFKLRIRYYSGAAGMPVFLEIKRRVNNCIYKQRVAIRREAVATVLQGQLPPAEQVKATSARQLHALHEFCRLVQQMHARPQMHVAYVREAYLPRTDNSARLTLDRQVRLESDATACLPTTMTKPLLVWGRAVVLELKFTNRHPNWFRDLVQTFNLTQCGAAKYVDGLTLWHGQRPQHRRMPRPNPDLQWPAVAAANGTDQFSGMRPPPAPAAATPWAGLSPGLVTNEESV
jgi:hypothetical protein